MCGTCSGSVNCALSARLGCRPDQTSEGAAAAFARPNRSRVQPPFVGTDHRSMFADMNKKSNLSLMGIYASSLHYKTPGQRSQSCDPKRIVSPPTKVKQKVKKNTTICHAMHHALCDPAFVFFIVTSYQRNARNAMRRALKTGLVDPSHKASSCSFRPSKKPSYPVKPAECAFSTSCTRTCH